MPGYKDGGPVRTLINLIELLGDEYEFRLAVLDRDHGDTEPYPNIKINDWNEVGKAKVWYYPEGSMNKKCIRALAKEVDLIYTCGFYDGYGYKTLALNKGKKLYGKPVVVASMGTFSQGALSQKSFKKKVFIALCKLLGWFKNITWSVTSTYEEEDVKRVVGKSAKCLIAEDLPRNTVLNESRESSKEGELKIAFLARICRHKNVKFAIECLKNLTGNISFTIGGPIYEQDYWLECQEELAKLPSNISWEYVGEVHSEKVVEYFSNQDVMILPTLGENYGHVIFEALSAGCIPVISDKTPWNGLNERGCGCVLSLETTAFVKALQRIVNLTETEKNDIAKKALAVAKEKLQQAVENTGYRKIFGE